MCNGFVVQDQQQLRDIALQMAREEEENSASKMRDAVQHAGEWKGKVTLLKKENQALRGELEVGFFLLSLLSAAFSEAPALYKQLGLIEILVKQCMALAVR